MRLALSPRFMSPHSRRGLGAFRDGRSRVGGALLIVVSLAWASRDADAAIAFRAAATPVGGNLTSVSVARPTGTLENDIMIAQVAVRAGSSVTIAAPVGWTAIGASQTNSTTVLGQRAFWRLAGTAAADPGPYLFTWDGSSQRVEAGIIAYSGVHATTPINVSNAQANAASTSVTAPSITPTVTNTMLVGLFSTANGNTSYTAPGGMTERYDAGSGGNTSGVQDEGADVIQAAAAATGTKTATAADSAVNIGQLIALTPSLCGNGSVDAGEACDQGGANGTTTSCCSAICQFSASTQQCRASAGVCDVAESCTGAAATCPADLFVSSSTVCRSSAGVCDMAESCTGSSAACPTD